MESESCYGIIIHDLCHYADMGDCENNTLVFAWISFIWFMAYDF